MAWERHGDWGQVVGAAAAGVVAMALLGVAEARTWSAMHNYGPEVRALSDFAAPPDWRPGFSKREPAAQPLAEKRWDAPGRVEGVRDEAIAAFTAWADPGSVAPVETHAPEYTIAQARKGRDRAQISISPAYGKPGVVGVSLSVKRDDRPVTPKATSI